MEDKLKAFLQSELGGDVEVYEFERLSGGYSQETFAFRARHGGVEHSLILRKAPASGGILQSDLGSEFRVIKALHKAGFPVPQVHWIDATGAHLGQPGFVMERVAGESKPEPLFEPGREQQLKTMACQIVDTLGRLHAMDPAELSETELPMPGDWHEYVNNQIDEMEQGFATVALEGHPLVAELFRWMRRNLPEPMPYRLVHCDYQLANFMYDDSGLKAVIDWEISHFGDPREDLGWLQVMCGLFGYDFTPHVEGGFLERYSQASGLPVTPQGVLFFQILRGFAITLTVMKNWRGFAEGEHRDIIAPYTCISVMRGLRVQIDAVGMTATPALAAQVNGGK